MALGKLDGVQDTNIGKASALTSSNLGKVGNTIMGYDSYTKLLLHMDGSNGSTTFTDSALSRSFTAYGNAQITTADGKFNQSAYFDGTGDYIKTPYTSDLDFGTGDYTIDFWMKSTQTGTHYLFDRCDGTITSYDDLALQIHSGELRLLVDDGTDTRYVVISSTSGANANNGSWNHIALVRYSGNTNIYVNGASKLSISISYNVTFTSSLRIGGQETFNNYYQGYIDEFRWSKGIARWTTTFTPPTSPY